jgi:26S proteasome regulatory subunit N1
MRKMAGAYAEEESIMPFIRIAQGLLNMGKGALTLNPMYSNNLLLSKTAFAGIIITLLSFTNGEGLIRGKYQYLLYSLCLAIRPRMVMTLNENLEVQPINFAVGQAVDTIGLPGNPKTISGYTVNTTPLLLNSGERCEASNEDYTLFSEILEDIVIVKEKPLEERQKTEKK